MRTTSAATTNCLVDVSVVYTFLHHMSTTPYTRTVPLDLIVRSLTLLRRTISPYT